jgi:hypothetical protein
MISKRPPDKTSSSVGSITVSTAAGVRAREARSSTCPRKPAMVCTSKRWATYPTAPARPKISGGRDKMVKNAASAARPVTR